MSLRSKTVRKTLVPMVAVQVYLALTVVLYVFGPWKWRDPNMLATVLILLLIQAALWVGFNTGKIARPQDLGGGFRFSKKILNAIVLFGFFVTLLQCLRTLGTIDLTAISQSVSRGLANAAAQYSESKVAGARFGGSALTYFFVLAAPLSWMALPLSLYHFDRLSIPLKIVAVLNILLEISRWLAIGTNKGVFDVFFTIAAVLVLRHLGKGTRASSAVKSRRAKIGIIVCIAFMAVAALWVFSNNVGSRINGHWENYEITNGNTPIDPDAPLMLLCPEALRPTLVLASSYLTQGYYAFSLARLVEWVPLLGAGNSMFLMENIQELTGTDLFSQTYQARLEQFDWDPLVNWHSFYVWIANDVGPVGVVVVLFLIGYFFYQVSFDAIERKDDLAVVLFCLFAIMFFYLPANNQVLSYPSTFMAFWVLFIVWKHRRMRSARRKGESA